RPSSVPFDHLNPHTSTLVVPLLHVASKYQLTRIHRQLVSHLESDWPIELADWDRLELLTEQLAVPHRSSPDGRVNELYLQDRLPEPVAAIKLARECDLPQILPAAYYQLSRIPHEHDWDKYHPNPSTGSAAPRVIPDLRTARWSMLETEDLHRLLQFREK